MRLSHVQRDVLRSILDGWELGRSDGLYRRYWQQKGGCGRGGPSRNVGAATVCRLVALGLVEEAEQKWPLTRFRITGAGKVAAAAASPDGGRQP